MLTGLDVAVIVLILLSGLFAMVRGLTREVLAILAWAGAAYVTYRCFPYLQPIVRQYIGSPWLADLTAGVGFFVLALIVLSVISHKFSERVRGSPAGGLDRSLGLLFGLARGMLIACVLYAVAVNTVFRESKPDWIQRARVTPALQQGANYLVSLFPKGGFHRIEPEHPIERPTLPPSPPVGQKAALETPAGQDFWNPEWRLRASRTMYAPLAGFRPASIC